MPKFAATLASLLLIASSIGVNIARYPQVGRMADAEQRTNAAESANSAPAAMQSTLIEPSNPDSLSADEAAVEAAKSPQVAAVVPTENPRVEEPVDPKPAAGAAPAQPSPAVPIMDVRPMVPVTSLQGAAGAPALRPGSEEVRRLPPVEPSVSSITDLQAADSDGTGAYTATSTP